MNHTRALHFVFKVANRNETIDFYKRILGMKVLRHEEFSEGCKASCNGPYDGKWSKTMIGYGPEDNHFVIELTYNYGVGAYQLGNDFQYIRIHNKEAYSRIINGSWPITSEESDSVKVNAPGGYTFWVHNSDSDGDPVRMVALSSSDIKRSIDYWSHKLHMTLVSSSSNEAVFYYSPNQCNLKLISIQKPVDHASAFGRIAFACPSAQLPILQELMDKENETILTRLVSLDTPGKATVQVIILADPDGHEICFVGDEAFRQLSQVDSQADSLLQTAITSDKSDEWYNKHGGKTTK
ncbi:Glyoxalase domain-containing protein isoform 1 [Schistosoma japonicum]|uniref:Glyoxalase domain-containing protein isoform 1 n=1 Tax=Schistosoma japonicum TaxID=6182 RepID=A0A4Z2D7L5_SCHJA|nr:Glyoxalase domain-containing protein isoform 1 [Schistosoma japonicum]TNN12149.1 Glyoxalase domain-containing protein isoform 1 [Schistosoma japonicum]TNN12150.1 Glyoxalase domain-containing protein isoform 1 [Schistosoma japonicum]TNN12152.1 Glyoxalase domain-containing protein isoform 1 [Schistosoma japonicum]